MAQRAISKDGALGVGNTTAIFGAWRVTGGLQRTTVFRETL